jgi:hypothetical protein
MKTLTSLAALTLLLAIAAAARADVGFEDASRRAGEPGDRVELTVGCGFCFPPCVGEPGHRHPAGDLHGTCMPGNRGKPPASFQIWLTPRKRSLDPFVCGPGEYPGGPCRTGSRPPHLPSFIYLGRAVPPRGSDEPADRPRDYLPRYRLIFKVPETRPGSYKYLLFCDSCVDGPRGSIVDDRSRAAGPLRVLPPIATANGGGGGGMLPWVGAGALVAILALYTAIRLRRGRVRGPHAERA